MRLNKEVELSGQAPVCPMELSDLVVGMNHLGWAPLRHDRFVLRRKSPFASAQQLIRRSDAAYWLEAKIDESKGQRTLLVKGNVPLSERRKIEALLDALRQGRRWLTREGPLG